MSKILSPCFCLLLQIEVVFRVISDWRLILLQAIEVFDLCLILVAFISNVLWYGPSLEHYQGWCAVISGLAVAFRVGLNSNEVSQQH